MPKFVQVDGGPRLSFPDDATEEQISAVMARDFAPASPNPPSFPVDTRNYDTGLERAAQDFQTMQQSGAPFQALTRAPSGSPAQLVGTGLQKAGQGLYAAVADYGQFEFGPTIEKMQGLPETSPGEPPSNLQALGRGQPLPAETQLKVLPGPLRVPAEAARGLVESGPQMAAVAGAEFVGVPPMISAPLIFGSTPEGFDPKQAAMAAALPFVGRYGGEIGGALARKLGVTTAEAENIFRKLGGGAAAAAFLGDFDATRIADLPVEQQHEAMIEAVANGFTQLALGPMSAESRAPTAGEVAGDLLGRSVESTTSDVPQRIAGERQAIEQAATEGPAPIIEPGSRTPGPPIVTVEDFPPAKPPVTPRPQIPRAPGSKFRPVVPETPAEERITAVEEIRRANARTTREIQKLFPKAQLSREAARAWRTAAWGPLVEPTTAQAGAEPGSAQSAGTLEKAETTKSAAPASAEFSPAPAPSAQAEPTGVERFDREYSPRQSNAFSSKVGLELSTVQDLDAMLQTAEQSRIIQERWRAVAEKAKTDGDPEKFAEAVNASIAEAHRSQLARESIEVATNSGGWSEDAQKLGARPLDWKSDAKARQWLKDNATAAGIALPDELKPKLKPAMPPAAGAEFSASLPIGGNKVKGKYDLVDAFAITTSDDLGYDPALQPRDRKRVAGQQQVAQIVRHLDPERLGAAPTTDLGAPIVDEQGQVLSGNGRTMAIRTRYMAGQGSQYRDWLIHNAQEFGLKPEQVAKLERPVLVRRVSDFGDLDKPEFARQSNQQQVAGMSEAEKASSDARMLAGSEQLLASFKPGDNGDVLAASNREFLNAFIKGTGDQNELLGKEGYNGPVLAKRVRNAVLGAFVGPENRTLLNQLLEEADRLNLKNSVNGVMAAAPALMRFKETPYDLSGIVTQAFRDLVRLRTTGEKLDEFLDNRPLLTDDQRTAESDLVLTFLHQAKSAKALAEGLGKYVQGAREALQDLQSGGMLGTQPATRRQLIERANARSAQSTQAPAQADLPVGQPQRAPGQSAETGPEGQAAASEPGPATGKAWVEVVKGSLWRSVDSTVRLSHPGSDWTVTIASTIGGDTTETFPSQAEAIDWLAKRHPKWRISPPPSSQGELVKAPVMGSQGPSTPQISEFRESGASFALNAASEATRAADRDLRTSQQRRDPGLAQAATQLNRESAPSQPGRRWFLGLRKIFAPATIDESAAITAGIIRHALGKEYESGRQADFALRPFRREFDRTPVGRNWTFEPGQVLPRNYEVMRAIDTGELGGLTPLEADFARVMRRLFDEAIDQVQSVSPDSLRNLIENYFPRIWEDPVGNAEKITQLLSKRPWEGSKSFLKKRILEYFTDGLELGLRPVSDNPVDVTLHKLGEMYRFVATRQAMEEAKTRGMRKFFYWYEKIPEGWRQVDDPSSKVWAPPTVTVKEAFDAQIRAKTLELMESLGVPHERLVKIGGKRWGFAESGTGKIVTKFGGPDFVMWHEFGHQMDYRYADLREALPTRGNSTISNELRALADLRYAGQEVPQHFKDYVRETAEKMANVFDAYVRAPELFQHVAPNAYQAFREWLDHHPEVKNPLNEIRPSLTLESAEAQVYAGGLPLLGKWMMPEGAAQVVDNYLQPGLGKFKWFRSLRQVSGLLNGVQLLGFFHGGFVLNDSFYSGIGLALYDAMQGKLGRAAGELAQIPISPFTSIYRGGKIKAAIENPAAANLEYQRLAKLAVEQNLRAGHGNFDPEFARRWRRALNEFMSEPSAGAAAETLWRAPMGAMQTVMKPVMDYLVPRMKLGIMARMAERVIADNADADPETIRRLLAKAADATEDRLGQVTYDNLFQMRAAKDTAQLAMRAYGWQLTKYRMIFGGTADWARAARSMAAGEKPEVTFRMTYLPAMVMGHAILGGILHYSLTGRRPQKLTDYLFPESGLVDAFGQPVRLAIADFVKDVAADVRSFPNPLKMGGDFVRKLAPMWNMAAEMYRNQDFWGTEIFTRRQVGEPELDHFMKNTWEMIQYLGSQTLPFSARGASRLEQAGASKLGQLGPLVGIVPAPRYATQTKAEARSDEIMRGRLGKDPQSKAQAARGVAEAAIVRDLRTGKINNEGEFVSRERAAGINPNDQRELTKLRERATWTPLQYKVHKMTVEQAMEIFDLATKEERVSIAPVLAEKINNAFDGGRLQPEAARRYVGLVMPFYRLARTAGPAPTAAAGAKPGYSAFSPQR